MALSPEDAAYIVDQFGIDVERPLLTQVSRFDPWKDPLGVIDAYRLVKQEFPDVQLALVGSMAHDDPEGWDYYNQTVAYADGDPDIYILSNLNNVGSVEVNAFQVHSAAVIQKSIKEGFGLTVTEALWKTRPTVAGRVGGIVAQIQDGETGWLVDSRDGVRRRLPGDPARPGEARDACASRQGIRAAALPDAALAARLARAVEPSARQRHRGRRDPGRRRSLRYARCAGKLIVVSNRGPVSYGARRDGTRTARRGGGGLVTALRSLVQHHDVTWIASAITDEDRVVAGETRRRDGA